eukprot:gene7919-8774_t
MRSLSVLIALFVFYITKTEGRLKGRRSLFDDDHFQPWSTFDLLSRDFEDSFNDDPFFEDDDFDPFFDELPMKRRPTLEKKEGDKTTSKKDAGRDVCDKKCKDDKKQLSFPKLASRVVVNNDKEFKFAMNVQGFDKGDISVKVENDFLKISGKKTCKKGSKKCGEKSFFRYQYLLPKHADSHKVKARFSKDGFLIVEMPKLPALGDRRDSLQIEDEDEEYLPKLKSQMASKSKRKDGEKKKDEPKDNEKSQDEATVEVVS